MKSKLFIFCLVAILTSFNAAAKGLDKNTAKMQAMDKITGRVSVINVPVNGAVNFGSLSIVVRSCKTRPAEEVPDNFAFVDISDKTLQGDEVNIFKGWMISSSPATHAVEHPIYDVWLLNCHDDVVEPADILAPEILAQRDKLPKASNKEEKNISLEEPIKEMQDSDHKTSDFQPVQAEFLYDEEEEIYNLGNITAEDENADSPTE